MPMNMEKTVKIRALAYGDLDAIVAIDKALLGKKRPEYWSMKIEATENRAPMASLVAELDGQVLRDLPVVAAVGEGIILTEIEL